MLESIRKYTSSFVVKVLFVVLILSFGVWGVADVFRPGGGGDWAIQVGDMKIPPQTVRDDYQRELNRLRQAVGGTLDAEKARAFGLPNQVVSGIIGRALIDSERNRLGLVVGDDAVRAAIQADASFHNASGTFDQDLFRRVLQMNGLTESGFVRLVRDDIARRQLIASVTEGVAAPAGLVDAIYRQREERRTAEYVAVAASGIKGIGVPDETRIKAFYEAHPELFSAPEYRAATALVLSAEALAGTATVSDAAIGEAYAARQSEFTEPERRSIEQVLVRDEAAARLARDRLAGGADFAAVASELSGQGASSISLDKVTRSQLPGALGEAAFALGAGELSQPLQSPLGWHVLKVTGIEPAREKPLAEVRDQLARELAREKATDELYALSTRLEDILGGGASIEEAASQLGLDPRKVDAIDAAGKDPSGAVVESLPEGFAATTFATAENSESPLTEAGSGTFYVVRVDRVTPAGVEPLASVREAVIAAWQAEQRRERAFAIAEEIAQAARAGTALSVAAEAKGLSAATTPPFTRNAAAAGTNGVPAALVGDVFAADTGDIKVVRSPDGAYVARVASVVAADPNVQSDAGMQVRKELDSQIEEDMLTQYSNGIRREFPVTMNTRVLEQVF